MSDPFFKTHEWGRGYGLALQTIDFGQVVISVGQQGFR
jgi:hypothetical protein